MISFEKKLALIRKARLIQSKIKTVIRMAGKTRPPRLNSPRKMITIKRIKLSKGITSQKTRPVRKPTPRLGQGRVIKVPPLPLSSRG